MMASHERTFDGQLENTEPSDIAYLSSLENEDATAQEKTLT